MIGKDTTASQVEELTPSTNTSTMKLLLVFFSLAALMVQNVAAFVPSVFSHERKSLALRAAMDAQALLQKARQLKAEAAAAEQALHKDRLEKKQGKDSNLDSCVDRLFPTSDASVASVVKNLKECKWSTDKLMLITKRIHEREINAQGKGHVEASLGRDTTKFENVSAGNEKDLARVEGLIDRLIEAAAVIDEEYMSEKRESKEQKHLSHVDLDHWTMGETAENLRGQVGELRREHEDQFQKRQESFNEAQRKKDLPKKN